MENISIGVDVGNGFTKCSNNLVFQSRVAVGELSKASDRANGLYEIKYDGDTYIVGDGNEFITSKRHLKEDYLFCILTAIALQSKSDDVSAILCIGVPIDTLQNTAYVQKIKDKYNTNEKYSFEFNGVKKSIVIKKCAVFTESGLPFLNDDKSDQIVIDVGTGTISVAHWKDMKIVGTEYKTYNEGMYVVCNKIIKEIKNRYNEDVSVQYIQDNLGSDTIKLNNKEYDFAFHKKLVARHITSVVSKINTDFKTNEVEKVSLIGGGAELTIDYWREDLENVECVGNPQFVNADVYQKYADVLSRVESVIK